MRQASSVRSIKINNLRTYLIAGWSKPSFHNGLRLHRPHRTKSATRCQRAVMPADDQAAQYLIPSAPTTLTDLAERSDRRELRTRVKSTNLLSCRRLLPARTTGDPRVRSDAAMHRQPNMQLAQAGHCDIASTKRAWREYVENGRSSEGLIRPHVTQAWERSKAGGCNPRLMKADRRHVA